MRVVRQEGRLTFSLALAARAAISSTWASVGSGGAGGSSTVTTVFGADAGTWAEDVEEGATVATVVVVVVAPAAVVVVPVAAVVVGGGVGPALMAAPEAAPGDAPPAAASGVAELAPLLSSRFFSATRGDKEAVRAISFGGDAASDWCDVGGGGGMRRQWWCLGRSVALFCPRDRGWGRRRTFSLWVSFCPPAVSAGIAEVGVGHIPRKIRLSVRCCCWLLLLVVVAEGGGDCGWWLRRGEGQTTCCPRWPSPPEATSFKDIRGWREGKDKNQRSCQIFF